MARHCGNRRIGDRIGERKRLKYRGNKNNKERRMIERENGWNNNLNGNEDLIVLNYISVTQTDLQCSLE